MKTDQIVEVAVLLSDLDCQHVIPGPDLIIHTDETRLSSMSGFVMDMHSTSGLLAQIRKSTMTLEQAEDEVLAFLRENRVVNGVLAGNSVHVDRKFLLRGMPRLFQEYLHPVRIFNVSSIKELCTAWYRDFPLPPKKLKHRSLDDILESIEEFQFYQKTVLKRKTEV